MRGLLADVNVQGHLPYLRRLMEEQGLMEILTEEGVSLVIFPDLGLDRGTDDRTLWRFVKRTTRYSSRTTATTRMRIL